jgi:hypothetical protein
MAVFAYLTKMHISVCMRIGPQFMEVSFERPIGVYHQAGRDTLSTEHTGHDHA